MRKTDWFGSGIKPKKIGIYETRNFKGSDSGFQHWNGKHWGFWGFDVDDADHCKREKSCFQRVEWRGLSSDPSLQKKEKSK